MSHYSYLIALSDSSEAEMPLRVGGTRVPILWFGLFRPTDETSRIVPMGNGKSMQATAFTIEKQSALQNLEEFTARLATIRKLWKLASGPSAALKQQLTETECDLVSLRTDEIERLFDDAAEFQSWLHDGIAFVEGVVQGKITSRNLFTESGIERWGGLFELAGFDLEICESDEAEHNFAGIEAGVAENQEK